MFTTFVLALSTVVGQAESVSPDYQHLKDLEYFVGDWKMEGEIKVDGEFGALKGLEKQKLVRWMSYNWMRDKSFLIAAFAENAGAPLEYTAVIGWDAARNQIRSWDFNAQGARLEYAHVKTPDGWVIDGPSIYPGGWTGTYRGVYTIVDNDTFRTEGSGTMKKGDQESKVTLSFVAKRQKPSKK